METWKLLDIDRKKLKIEGRRLQINDPDFWNNREKAVEITREIDEREKEINEWDGLRSEIRSLEELVAMAQEENDDSLGQEVDKKYEELKNKYEKLEFLVLFSEKYDESNAIISVHAGTGGVDAQDWAEILERMFLRFAEKMNWKAEALDRTAGSEAGIKNTMIHIKGRWAYGYLKSESGVHRLVRISPFDAEAMRHTSFALVEVLPEMEEIEDVAIDPKDLRVDTFMASGHGGQSVNTTYSAVRIVHIPTGLTVTCQNERSQLQNKATALKILKSKLHKIYLEERQSEKQKLRGAYQEAAWGNQARSYVMQPYKMVKDHRTKFEVSDVDKVLDGNLDGFIESYLRSQK